MAPGGGTRQLQDQGQLQGMKPQTGCGSHSSSMEKPAFPKYNSIKRPFVEPKLEGSGFQLCASVSSSEA